MEWNEIQEGDIIELVSRKKVTVAKIDGDRMTTETGIKHYQVNWPEITLVNRPVKTPVNWPPQLGDIWEAGSKEYFARKYHGLAYKETVTLENAEDKNDIYVPDDIASFKNFKNFKNFLALNPVCLRRRNK